MSDAPRFDAATAFAVGVEEELLCVDRVTHALDHHGIDALGRMEVHAGSAHPDLYAALVELASPVCSSVGEAVGAIATLRADLIAAGATPLGAGIHPAGAFGDVVHVDTQRYHEIGDQLRGLARRTPTCALHVHVGMPDAETALRVYNGLREWLPLIQSLAANSPFWHGQDSRMASARAQMFRAYPRADIPPAFASWDEYETTIDAVVRAGDAEDYTFLWWDLRPHPRLGTVELRAMDAQSALWSVAGLAGLVHGLARAEAGAPPREWSSREALEESSFRAARDGMAATLWFEGALRPVPEILAAALDRAADDPALEEVERFVLEGGGADRQRTAHARGGMPALLALLVAETAASRP